MKTRKSKTLPFIITVLVLIIIIYLFMNIKQPYVECSKETTFDGGVVVSEELKTTFNANKIAKLELIKTIKFSNGDHLNSIEKALDKAYDYLGDDSVKIERTTDTIVIRVNVSDDETILLNNISFINNGNELDIKIDNNTKSSEVTSLKISDNYTEGEFITRMKNNGYSCK